jgi:lipid II:glycine glycyltransferase (peptidoglycan interpeptide bridge formation enzyme)
VRRQAGDDPEGLEGQGEVIEVAVRPVPLSSLDANEEMLQSGFWGRFKEAHGWQPHPFSVSWSEAGRPASDFAVLVLTRRLVRTFTIAYVPFGPVQDPLCGRGAFLSSLASALRGHLPRATLFLRYDLPWKKEGEAPRARGRRPVVKAASDMQPPSTVVVDIAPPLEDILKGMKPKTRYNVRLAAKKGVEVQAAGLDALDAWYGLYQETGRRDRIAIHSREYYRGLLRASEDSGGESPVVRLLLARHEGRLLAGNIVAFWKKRAAYLYGASSGEERNLMPTYALQWEAIRMAREAGCTSYDLFGVPAVPDPAHPMFGLYQFKTGFSDCVLERWGTWDAPYRPALYALYRAAEGARMFYYRNVKKLYLRERRHRVGKTDAEHQR